MNTLANPPLIHRSEFTVSEVESGAISISWFYNDVPSFAEAELIRLYQNTFSTLLKFRVYGSLDGVSTYVARKRGDIVTVFLFRQEGQRVSVLNEFLDTDEEELKRFAHHIFSTFKSIDAIHLGPLRTEFSRLAFTSHRVNCNEDIVITLPACPDEYLRGLGRSTRQNINHYEKKLIRAFPTLTTAVVENEQIDELHFRKIIRLNQERMAGKEKAHGIDESEIRRLFTLVKSTGMVMVVSVDGQICAGAILCRTGDNFFLNVIAHDSKFNEFGLGTYCCYLAVRECISRGGKEFHFLWGREQYKYRLGGVQQDFDLLTIYRSRLHLVMDVRNVLAAEAKSRMRQAKFWLLAPERRNSNVSQRAMQLFRTIRRIRQIISGRAKISA